MSSKGKRKRDKLGRGFLQGNITERTITTGGFLANMTAENMIDAIINGDNMKVMATMADDSIDLMVTDPPYGLVSRNGSKKATGGFMGKAWDKAVPSVDTWKECLRVLKPGAFAFILCIPRQDCLARMIVNLEDAGFDVSYSSLLHCFGTGFPKSQSVSKVIDKRLGVEREVIGKYIWPDGLKRNRSEAAMLPGRVGTGEIPNITVPATPEAMALDGAYSNYSPKPCYEVAIVASKPVTVKHRRSDVYEMLDRKYDYWYTQRTEVKEPNEHGKGNIEKLSEKWQAELEAVGYTLKADDVIERRLALIPEHEDEVIINREVILRSKPYRDTDITSTITHALATGKQITWLDDGRIPYKSEQDEYHRKNRTSNHAIWDNAHGDHNRHSQPQGRFSPNLLCSDNILDDGRVTSNARPNQTGKRTGSDSFAGKPGIRNDPQDSGSFSRYFSLDSWAEKHLPESVRRTFPFLCVPKASKSEKNAGLDGLEESPAAFNGPHRSKNTTGSGKPQKPITHKNHHATVKPIKLMSYLITIGSRPGDVILDPFVGSGTTAVAAVILDRHYIGIELDSEMCDISERRIKWHIEQAQKEAEPQPDMFDEKLEIHMVDNIPGDAPVDSGKQFELVSGRDVLTGKSVTVEDIVRDFSEAAGD